MRFYNFPLIWFIMFGEASFLYTSRVYWKTREHLNRSVTMKIMLFLLIMDIDWIIFALWAVIRRIKELLSLFLWPMDLLIIKEHRRSNEFLRKKFPDSFYFHPSCLKFVFFSFGGISSQPFLRIPLLFSQE